jgi:hypothetical protein
MKVVTAFLLSFLLVVSVRADAPWGDLSGWIGKYPSDQAVNGGILEIPSIAVGLRKVLSDSDRKLLKALTSETPIQTKDQFVLVEKCRPHNCPADRVMIVLDTKEARLWVGFFQRRANSVATRWYGSADDYVVLPPSILQLFRDRHAD